MLHKMVVVYDVKAEVYNKPVFVPSYAAGVRAFQDAVNDVSSDFNRHPEDYIMFGIGEYDDVKCAIISEPALELAKAIALKDK